MNNDMLPVGTTFYIKPENINWKWDDGDLISRSELKKKLQARRDNGEEDFDKGYNIGIETAIELIDSAPIVTPQALINGIKDIINKNGITSVDELLEILKKGG